MFSTGSMGMGYRPKKNGDWAWFLHVLKSLTEDGKAAIIMPHGIFVPRQR